MQSSDSRALVPVARMRACCYVVFGEKLSRDWPDVLGDRVLGPWSTLRIRGSDEQSLRTGSIAQTRIEGDDSRRFDVECGRQMQRVKSAERRSERQHQPLGTTMDRRRQLGVMRRRVKLRGFTVEPPCVVACEALLAHATAECRCHLRQRKVGHDDIRETSERAVQVVTLWLRNE